MQGWRWTKRYAAQPEILRYLDHVADRFDLRRNIQLNAVTSAVFDEAVERWGVETDRGDRVWRVLVTATVACRRAGAGPPGPQDLRGPSVPHRQVAAQGGGLHRPARRHHRHRLLRDPVHPDHRPAAAHLFVFQRTPNFACPPRTRRRHRVRAAGEGDLRRLPASGPRVAGGLRRGPGADSALAVSRRGAGARVREAWRRGGLGFSAAYTDLLISQEANDTAAEFFRAKIRAIVRDPAVADPLAPDDHPLGTKRLCVDTDYYATFNRENVTLVDIRRAPIQAITPAGVRTGGASTRFDVSSSPPGSTP